LLFSSSIGVDMAYRFLWVSLQLENLSDPQRMFMEADVRAELQQLPESLADLYAAACDQIERSGPSSRHVATTTLRWLLCAQRPMTTQEVIGAISVDHEAKLTSLTVEQVVATCRNIVVHDQDLDILHFAHLSVRDYLESREGFSTSENESMAAERCLDVVSATYSTLPVPGQKLKQNLDVQAYATVHWPFHYRNIEPDRVSQRLERKIFRFFFRGERHDNAFTNWISAFSQKCEVYEDDVQIMTTFASALSDPPTPLFTACIFRLPNVLSHLAQTSQHELERCNNLGQSALSLATEYGQFDIVRLLMQPSITEVNHATLPLTVPLQVGHSPEVVYYISAMQAALASKRPEAVNMILTRGRQTQGGTQLLDYALEVAAWMGDRNMVSLFLSHGADVRCPRPGPKFHLLAQAAILGMDDLAEHLLDNGVDVETLSWDGRGMSILEYAALNDSPSIIKLAMERGASIITANMVEQMTAFHDAASWNHVKCIQSLFDGASARDGKEAALRLLNHKTTRKGETALHYAARQGHSESVSLLLNLGAADLKDREGYTAFQRSLIDGNVDILMIFLSKSCGNKLKRWPDWDGATALHCASYHGHLEVCDALLSYDPGCLFLEDDDSNTPLHCAVTKGHSLVARLLVRVAEYQQDYSISRWLNKQNRWQKTHLISAASHGFPETLQILLDHGADPTVRAHGPELSQKYQEYNAFSGLAFTALHAAIAFQEWNCVETLVNHCAANMSASSLSSLLDMADGKGRSALALAAELNAAECMDLLIKHGATPVDHIESVGESRDGSLLPSSSSARISQ
jgi:ankyrin repeat protein